MPTRLPHSLRATLPPLILIIVALAVRLPLLSFTSDDALITMRHSRNLATGHGLVYNPGERVLGSTTPLFSLMLTLPARLAPHSTEAAAKAIGLASDCAVILLIYLILCGSCRPFWAFVGGAYYALNPLAAQWSISGMETSLYTLLIAAGFWSHQRNHRSRGIVAGLCMLARPDGIAVLGSMGLDTLIAKRRIAWRTTLTAALIVLPWLVFSACYYQQILPQSMVAKTHQSWPDLSTAFRQSWGYLVTNPIRLPSTLLIIAGLVICGWRQHSRLVAIWALAYVAGFTLMRVYMYAWYQAPLELAFAIAIATALASLETRALALADRFRPVRCMQVAARVCLVTGLVALGVARCETARRRLVRHVAYLTDTHRAMATWLHKQGGAEKLVAMGDIGYIGWFSEMRILDLVGLVSPDILQLEAETAEAFTASVLETCRPDFYLFRNDEAAALPEPMAQLFARHGYLRGNRYPQSEDMLQYGLMSGKLRACYDVFIRDERTPSAQTPAFGNEAARHRPTTNHLHL